MRGKGRGGGQRALSGAVGGKYPAAYMNTESNSRKRHKLDTEVECNAKLHEKLNKKQKSIGGFTSRLETEDSVLWSPSSRLDLPLRLLQGVDARKPQMTIPRIGFGTYRLKKNAVTEPLKDALTAGYTMLDTASV
ncbi:hypothetical protein HDU85_006651 [Gaertneriomyces sp. JEL0708]|nr:hypothetical protein HDU85_006651 [Gaertneriomyces sp. JEL0708]